MESSPRVNGKDGFRESKDSTHKKIPACAKNKPGGWKERRRRKRSS
jgi:hypothetical protein